MQNSQNEKHVIRAGRNNPHFEQRYLVDLPARKVAIKVRPVGQIAGPQIVEDLVTAHAEIDRLRRALGRKARANRIRRVVNPAAAVIARQDARTGELYATIRNQAAQIAKLTEQCDRLTTQHAAALERASRSEVAIGTVKTLLYNAGHQGPVNTTIAKLINRAQQADRYEQAATDSLAVPTPDVDRLQKRVAYLERLVEGHDRDLTRKHLHAIQRARSVIAGALRGTHPEALADALNALAVLERADGGGQQDLVEQAAKLIKAGIPATEPGEHAPHEAPESTGDRERASA